MGSIKRFGLGPKAGHATCDDPTSGRDEVVVDGSVGGTHKM